MLSNIGRTLRPVFTVMSDKGITSNTMFGNDGLIFTNLQSSNYSDGVKVIILFHDVMTSYTSATVGKQFYANTCSSIVASKAFYR